MTQSQKISTSYFSLFFICPLSFCSVCMNHGRKCVSLLHKSVEKRHFYRIYSHRPWKLWRGKFGEKETTLNRLYALCYFPIYRSYRRTRSDRRCQKKIVDSNFYRLVLNSCCLKTVYYKVSEFHFRRTIYSWEKNSPLLY